MAGRQVRRGRRDPRQDHDHRRCSPGRSSRPARTRRTPSGRPRRHRQQRGRGDRRPLRRRGRRERRRLPALRAVRRDRHEHRGRPPRPLGDRGGVRRGFDDFAATVDPDGFLVCCVDDAGAAALAGAAAGGRPARGDRVDAAADVGQTSDRRRWPASRSGRPATTTSPTRCWRSPPGAPSATPTPSWPRHRVVHRDPAADGAQGRGRRASGSTTAMRTTRPRSPATSPAARELAGHGRLLVAFQPHLVSRTRTFGDRDGRGSGRGRRGRRLRRLPRPGGCRPRRDGRAGGVRRTPPSRARRLRARPRRRPGRRWSPGRAPETWC